MLFSLLFWLAAVLVSLLLEERVKVLFDTFSFKKKNDSKNGRGAAHRAAPFVYALQAVMPFSVIR